MHMQQSVLDAYNQMEKAGALDTISELRKENRELERTIVETGTLISFTDINSMLDYTISRILDHFIPEFFAFLVYPPRGENLRQYCYRNLKPSKEKVPSFYYHLLANRFQSIPASVSFAEISEELGKDLFNNDFLNLEPEYLFPMSGIGGIYGIVIMGKKMLGGEYTIFEKQYVERLIKVLSVSMQNGLHYESSITDPKTGLYTHDYFLIQIKNACSALKRHNRSFGVLMIDIDHFKRFNDTYGHITGDIMIIAIAKILVKYVRSDDYVARFGGEEFSILLTECTAQSLMIIAERIRFAVEKLRVTNYDNKILSATISIGARYIETCDKDDINSIIEAADKALYKSKENGRNRASLYFTGLKEKASFYL